MTGESSSSERNNALRTVPIGFIGGGNMAQAILRGLLHSGHEPGCLLVSDPDARAQAAIGAISPEVRIARDNAEVARAAGILVLAVKPQLMADVLRDLSGRREQQLVISVAAGVSLATLEALLDARTPIVRAMPNQPALVGAGISALVGNAAITASDRQSADYVAAAIGTGVWLEDETLMDAVTAVSGSGPAYFYLLMEAMERAGADLGLPPELARRLTRATAQGAARTVLELGREPAELRAGVTSPGGTTAAALAVMAAAGFSRIVADALRAARDRSAELGGARPPEG